MAQVGTIVNRISGRNLIAEQNHMSDFIERTQHAQDQAGQSEQSQSNRPQTNSDWSKDQRPGSGHSGQLQ